EGHIGKEPAAERRVEASRPSPLRIVNRKNTPAIRASRIGDPAFMPSITLPAQKGPERSKHPACCTEQQSRRPGTIFHDLPPLSSPALPARVGCYEYCRSNICFVRSRVTSFTLLLRLAGDVTAGEAE